MESQDARTRVGIISMIDDEEFALQACFSEFFGGCKVGRLERYSDFPYRIYAPGPTFVQAGERVAVYHFHINATGNVDVGTLATAAIIEEGLNFVLLVGVAGGRAPKLKHFDVVIPSEVYFYEVGKIKNGGFSSYNKNVHPDARLRNWARSVAMESKWIERLPVAFRVFAETPAVDFGMLAAGDKVITDSAHQIWLDIIDHAPKTVATEMESYGCLKAAYETGVPALTIRSVSDLLDDKDASGAKDKNNKRVAAAIAATFATALLAHIRSPISNQPRMGMLIDDLNLEDVERVTLALKAVFGDRVKPIVFEKGSLKIVLEGDHDGLRALALLIGAQLLREVSTKILVESYDVEGIEEALAIGRRIRGRTRQLIDQGLSPTSELFGMIEASGLIQDEVLKAEIARRIYAEADRLAGSELKRGQRIHSSKGQSEWSVLSTSYYKRLERVLDAFPGAGAQYRFVGAVVRAFDVRNGQPAGSREISEQFGFHYSKLPELRLVLNKRNAVEFFCEELGLPGTNSRSIRNVTLDDYMNRFKRRPLIRGRSSYWFTLAEWNVLLGIVTEFPLPQRLSEMASERGIKYNI